MQPTSPKRRPRLTQYLSKLSQYCAYRHLYELATSLRSKGKLTAQIRTGRNIALLGLFCPIFWIALFSGAKASTLAFHAAHSGIVVLIGITVMAVGMAKLKKTNE